MPLEDIHNNIQKNKSDEFSCWKNTTLIIQSVTLNYSFSSVGVLFPVALLPNAASAECILSSEETIDAMV